MTTSTVVSQFDAHLCSSCGWPGKSGVSHVVVFHDNIEAFLAVFCRFPPINLPSLFFLINKQWQIFCLISKKKVWEAHAWESRRYVSDIDLYYVCPLMYIAVVRLLCVKRFRTHTYADGNVLRISFHVSIFF